MSLSNKYLVFPFVLLALVLGGLSSADTANNIWYIELNKSNLNPPGYVFAVVWPILYLLMSISAFRTFKISKNLFYLQLIFNALWSWLFFAFQLPLFALLNIWLLIFLNMKILLSMFKVDKLSAFLYVPYIIWLLFASYLNLFIVINN